MGKVIKDTHLEGWWNDSKVIDEIAWGWDVWSSKVILEEDGMEGFKILLWTCLEEDKVEAFESLNIKFEVFSIFNSFKKDLGIHIDLESSLDVLEHISLVMDLGTHTFFGLALWIVDLCDLFCVFSFLAFTCQLEET